MTTSPSDSFVSFPGGLTLPVEAVRLALSLEARGLHLAVDGDLLRVGPRGRLTAADRRSIRRWRDHLRAIALYDADAARVQ